MPEIDLHGSASEKRNDRYSLFRYKAHYTEADDHRNRIAQPAVQKCPFAEIISKRISARKQQAKDINRIQLEYAYSRPYGDREYTDQAHPFLLNGFQHHIGGRHFAQYEKRIKHDKAGRVKQIAQRGIVAGKQT